jgi:hypothetical protein
MLATLALVCRRSGGLSYEKASFTPKNAVMNQINGLKIPFANEMQY